MHYKIGVMSMALLFHSFFLDVLCNIAVLCRIIGYFKLKAAVQQCTILQEMFARVCIQNADEY